MCLNQSTIVGLNTYNWDGDKIYFDPIVPSNRAVVGKFSKVTYKLDIREFLTGDNNAVIRKTVEEDIKRFALSICADIGLFTKRGKGGFDYRVSIISQYVGHNIRYRTRKNNDPWRFPEETLMIKEGDCEDIAFLLASLLFSAGVSPYNIRVALGQIKTTIAGNINSFDHAWVMYKRESGKWMVLEPLDLSEKKKSKSTAILLPNESVCIYEYKPDFLFNWQHLWVVDNDANKRNQTLEDVVSNAWDRMNPTFAGHIHNNIVHSALFDLPDNQRWIINELDKRFTHIVPFLDNTIVDDPDWPSSYHPYDHFDSGFIEDGWRRVTERLNKVKANNNPIGNFAWAAHGIADFYSHSSYVHFAKLIKPEMDGGYAELYDPSNPSVGFATMPEYGSGLFDFNKFSINTALYTKIKKDAATLYKGQIISGRYAQKPDSRSSGVFEQLAEVPKDVCGRADYYEHGALPHHDEIAVDDPDMGGSHSLYKKEEQGKKISPIDIQYYANQYRWRYFSAIQHIRKSFFSNWPR
ncbi:MAG: transglutaminase-like domain-containing protein [Methylobacter sp.]